MRFLSAFNSFHSVKCHSFTHTHKKKMPRKSRKHQEKKREKEKVSPNVSWAAAAANTTAEETPSAFGKVDCARFVFASADDAVVFAAVEEVLQNFQASPSARAFAAVQGKLVALAGYPLVTAVLAGRYPRLFSSLKTAEAALQAGAVAPMDVAGVSWDLWCRNTWLTNSCAVDDLGDVAQLTLPSLAALLRRVERDNDNHVNEVWSVLHILAWALRSSSAAGAIVESLTQCTALWELIETELITGGRHTSLQLVLLDLLGALALYASSSADLFTHLCAVAGARAQFLHPVHYHTAMRLCYACVLCDDEAQTNTRVTMQHLRQAWASMKAQAGVIPAPLRATEWVVGDAAKAHLAIAARLHHCLAAAPSTALDIAAVREFHATALLLPAEARAFCLYAMPGNALLWLHAMLEEAAAPPDLVAEVVTTLIDVVLGKSPSHVGGDDAGDDNGSNDDDTKNYGSGRSREASAMEGYVQYCIQQLWMNGLSATLHTLLRRRDPAITAAVVGLLHHLAARSLHGSAARRVLLGSPAVSLVADVLSGVAESADVKAELKKAAVFDVVTAALRLVCVLETAELTSVLAESLVSTVGTLISEGKESVVLLRCGLRALARLASAFPMAGSMVLDFEFLTEQCGAAEPPTDASAAFVVGSLDVMSAIVVQQPAAVTFEWIETLLGIMQNLDGWRDSVANLDAALWRCVQYTVEASEDCNVYLFSEEAQDVLRNELERMKYQDPHLREILPSLLRIAVCMQAFERAKVNAAMQAVLASVPAKSWTAAMSEAALHFLVAAAAAPAEGEKEESDGRLSAQIVAALAERVMDGAQQSGVVVPMAALEEFSGGLEGKDVVSEVIAALFEQVDRVVHSAEKANADEKSATLSCALLPLLHCVVSSCPSARTEATAASAAQFLTCVAAAADDDGAGLNTPAVIDAALLLVSDACAINFADADADDETKRTRLMEKLWSSLDTVTREAIAKSDEAGWQRVLSRVFGTAHALLLGSTTVPFRADGDPRLDFVGSCGLPNVAVEPCNALVQTVLNYNDARMYLQHKYAPAYFSSLEYMADPAHNIGGVVPLPLMRYLSEAKIA